MTAIYSSFKQMLKSILKDAMLAIVIIVPILCATLFRFGIPAIEHLLCNYFGKDAILKPYYQCFDILLGIMTPYLLCFASTMHTLVEIDDQLSTYLSVTPLGKQGYLHSRLTMPVSISFLANLMLLKLFSLTTQLLIPYY